MFTSKEAIIDRQTGILIIEKMLIGQRNLNPKIKTFIFNRSRESSVFPKKFYKDRRTFLIRE